MNNAAALGYTLGLRKQAVAGPVGLFLAGLGKRVGALMRGGQTVQANKLIEQARHVSKLNKADPRAAMQFVQGGTGGVAKAAPAVAPAVAPAAAAAAPAAAAPAAAGAGAGAGEGIVAELGSYTRKGLGMIDPSLAKTRMSDTGLGTLTGGLGLGTGAHFLTQPDEPYQYA